MTLEGKPIAAALVAMSNRVDAEATAFLAELASGGVKTRSFERARLFEDRITNGIAHCVGQIVGIGLSSLGRPQRFVYGTTLPSDAGAVISFATILMAGLKYELKVEGIEVNNSDLHTEFAKCLFLEYPADSLIFHYEQGVEQFRLISAGENPTFVRWRDTIFAIATLYVMKIWPNPTSEEAVQLTADIGEAFRDFLRDLH